MSVRLQSWLFVAQRLTAMILAPLVLLHLVTILYAVSDGLTANEILGRTRDNLGWAAVYGLFVGAAAIHGAIGLRTIAGEMLRANQTAAGVIALGYGLLVTGLGWRAVATLV